MPKRIFVFGSNEAGIHGAGAARFAQQNHGAIYGKGFGHYGDSFAIPTKDTLIETLPLATVEIYVKAFLQYARSHPKLTFHVTQIGCGLAGFTSDQIAPLFQGAPRNCLFDQAWEPQLGDTVLYWGTHP